MKPQTTYLASKPHYEILDGLRGVAALMVVAFHLFEPHSDHQRKVFSNEDLFL